ncbi:MAG TPA: hypothetical protein VLB46_04390 [Pyrinomonadaceae bacterium]|nr:hypothetical protein [Pyrinomonadaceae bacterium]
MTAQTLAQKPTIKILLYTDDPTGISDGKNLLGLSSMIQRLKAHAPVFADLSIKWVSRSSDQNHHADNKLNLVMCKEVEETGEPFDEIWFFGLHQANTENFSLGVFRGGPESELTADEVDELDKWMKVEGGSGGGVLMTGDHNNPVPPNWLRNGNGHCTDTVEAPQFLGLGRAIGRCVPRAGELRKWDGSPSSRAVDCLNTVGAEGFQTDRVPQKLIHELVNADGEPDPKGQPHPLFLYRPGSFIDIFPDHRHEGALVIPDLSNTAVWPVGANGQPKPRVVAFGTDRRTGKRIGLVTAYDGDPAGVGRIVADSSWHHYVNVNLKGFPHPAPPKSDSHKIGQFYGNLAIWLAPIHKRRQMAEAMYWELAQYTLLLEPHDNPTRTGEVAYSLLRRSTSACEVHELLRAFGQQPFCAGDLANTEQETLGLVLDSYQKVMIRAERETVPAECFEFKNIVSQELTKAKAAVVGPDGGTTINVTNTPLKGRDKSSTLTTTLETKEWTIELKRDSSQTDEPPFATLVFRLDTQNGVVTGEVWNGIESQFISTVTGTHEPVPGDEHWLMRLEFVWGNVSVTLSGETVETPSTVLFNGRYTARALTAVASNGNTGPLKIPASMAPADGDTGTGTGQQT